MLRMRSTPGTLASSSGKAGRREAPAHELRVADVARQDHPAGIGHGEHPVLDEGIAGPLEVLQMRLEPAEVEPGRQHPALPRLGRRDLHVEGQEAAGYHGGGCEAPCREAARLQRGADPGRAAVQLQQPRLRGAADPAIRIDQGEEGEVRGVLSQARQPIAATGALQAHLAELGRRAQQRLSGIRDAPDIAAEQLRLLDGERIELRLALRPLPPGAFDLQHSVGNRQVAMIRSSRVETLMPCIAVCHRSGRAQDRPASHVLLRRVAIEAPSDQAPASRITSPDRGRQRRERNSLAREPAAFWRTPPP
jgi:hypothetical protein